MEKCSKYAWELWIANDDRMHTRVTYTIFFPPPMHQAYVFVDVSMQHYSLSIASILISCFNSNEVSQKANKTHQQLITSPGYLFFASSFFWLNLLVFGGLRPRKMSHLLGRPFPAQTTSPLRKPYYVDVSG